MRSLTVDGCRVDIIPVVNGLVSEAEKVRKEFGDYEAYGVALGIEGVQAIKNRGNMDDTFDVSELDIAYAKHMERFGQVEMPSPAICEFIDLCTAKGINVIALDMNDSDFTELYCNTVKTFDFVKEHRLAKKGMKRKFKASTPEEFAIEWDEHVNSVRGYRDVSLKREEYVADQIRDVAKYRSSLLVVLEIERVDGVVAHLEGTS